MALKTLTTDRVLLDGKLVEPAGKGHYTLTNPATGADADVVPECGVEDVTRAVAAAKAAFEDGRWSGIGPSARSAALYKLADTLEQHLDDLAAMESRNVGKPIKLAHDSDLPFAIDCLRFFAGAARTLDGRASHEYVPGYTSMIRREPIGVCGQLAPWNYPLMMAMWKIGPALAAGNTVVLKPAPETPLTTLALGVLAQEAGLPAGVLNIVTGGDDVGKALVAHPDVRLISLTGATETGKAITKAAADTLKRVHMELGGKAPFIVFNDADLEAAAQGAVVGGFVNTGQDCTAATRIYVQESVYDTFVKRLLELVGQIRVGDPASEKTDMGPLVSAAQLERVEMLVNSAKGKGAFLTGGKRATVPGMENGFFYEPTIITRVADDAPVVTDEIFGPVIVVLPFSSEDEVIARANAVRYALAGSVWTGNTQRAMRTSAALQFGTVWVNDHLPLTGEMPHGGFKQSGFGKDMSLYAIDDYTQIKHVMFDNTGAQRKPWHYTIFGDAE
ncbi:MAG: 4-aminobutyraldehyde dehydrogenase [Ktedonobacterales bacterium]|jgi:betaine-aldehyde dehydrogenase|nr:MAG: 4-aminobutyraldehyde dehydrogenase [Ktedonobacterales bacterium]